VEGKSFRSGFRIFGDDINILEILEVTLVDSPSSDPRLVLNWTPSSTKCFTSHWLSQRTLQLTLVTIENLCWNWKHDVSNLGPFLNVREQYVSQLGVVTLACALAYSKVEAPKRDNFLSMDSWVHVLGQKLYQYLRKGKRNITFLSPLWGLPSSTVASRVTS
jgi:hypothetical protein